ncbi:MAG: ribosomal RNA small subunit methyltransferase A [Candidatus Buchananbacteria bacterium]|nr:ribosomal RNA small subunit methyltransferase A [Candidatus Buchananbacteria bacterium]
MNTQEIKKICKIYDIRPDHDKGQNFLISPAAMDQVIQAAQLSPNDSVLEIGPGLGFLTARLIEQAKRLVSVELDYKLFRFLLSQFPNNKKLDLVNQDILKFDPTEHGLVDYKIVANLPYNITSFFLKKFLTLQAGKPKSMTLMLQKEVAERICAKPGSMSLLSISVQVYCQPEITARISKNDFWPVPKIDSAVINLNAIMTNQMFKKWLGSVNENDFWQVVRIGFSARRKQLHNNLSAGLHIASLEAKSCLLAVGLAENVRPQDLSIGDWLGLVKKLKKYFK